MTGNPQLGTPIPAEGSRPVLDDLRQKGLSGLLILTRDRVRTTLCMVHGRTRFAITNLRRFQLMVWLAEQGLARPEKLTALKTDRPGTLGLLDLLSREKIAPRQDLVSLMQQRLREIVRDAQSWKTGQWRFEPGHPVLENEVLLDDLQGHGQPSSPGQAAEVPPSKSPDGSDEPGTRALLDHFRENEGLDFYQLLGVSQSAGEEEIRSAYHSLARRYHPDTLKDTQREACQARAEEYFAAVTEAYNILTRPGLRAEYDENLKIARQPDTRQATQDAASLARANHSRGRRSRQEGKLHEAYEFFKNAVGLDPEQPEYHRDLGVLEMQNPRWRKQAEGSLKKALELQPMDVCALTHLGELYMRNGLHRRAAHCFKTALGWDPTNRMALEGMKALESGAKPNSGGLLKGLFHRG
ncbi:MAG: DnaJ domain-containing protein [Acidobacteriota bacterium]